MTGSKSLTRQHYSPEFKLRLVRMALKTLEENGSVAALARQHNVNDNLLFKWMRLCKLRAASLNPAGVKLKYQHCPRWYRFR